MKSTYAIGICSLIVATTAAHAGLVNFTYTQTSATTGSGTIPSFVAGGHTFNATPFPAATVFDPNPGVTPAGFVGAQTVLSGFANEPNNAVGLLWSGIVTASSSDGFLIDIPLIFVPKQTQAPTDINDYTWNITWGDSVANGIDTISSGNLRVAMLYGRDNVVDNVETAETFQRYTQNANIAFTAGQNTFVNTDTSFNANIKDATDGGAPAGNDAAGKPLAFYWMWRDQAGLTQGAILIDDFGVGGLLNADDASIRPVPEPASTALLVLGSSLMLRRRRR